MPYHAVNMSCIHLKRGLFTGSLTGGMAGVWVFAWCGAMSLMPGWPGSLSHVYQPWWRPSNWLVGLVVGLVFGLPVGVIAAFRPVVVFVPSVASRTPMQQLGRFLQGFFLGLLVLPFAAAPVLFGLGLAFPGVVAQWQLLALLGAAAVGCGVWAMRRQ